MLAPFLPGTAENHGLSETTVGLIFAMHPLGSIATSLMLPWMLRQPWADTFQFIRRATAGNALCVCCVGLLGLIEPKPDELTNSIAFGLPLILLRFGQGICVTFMEVSNETISLKLLPRAYIGPVQGVIMATRTLAIIAGPVLGGFLYQVRDLPISPPSMTFSDRGITLGGFLYQAGCWALPFTVGASLLAFATLFLIVVLPRKAPDHMRTSPKDASWPQVSDRTTYPCPSQTFTGIRRPSPRTFSEPWPAPLTDPLAQTPTHRCLAPLAHTAPEDQRDLADGHPDAHRVHDDLLPRARMAGLPRTPPIQYDTRPTRRMHTEAQTLDELPCLH